MGMLLGPALPEAHAQGEASSWLFQSNGARKKTKTSNVKVPPSSDKGPGDRPAGTDALFAGYKLPLKGDSAAQIAFDQGEFQTAMKLAQSRAKNKDGRAATLIGDMLAGGLGIHSDIPAAARWYKLGGELGDPEGSFRLAMLLIRGDVLKKDPLEAAKWFEAAARSGHLLANYNLGQLFLSGTGKPENPVRGAMHVRYAAENNIAAAQYDLATLYQRGHGVEPDAYLAATWLRRAAEQGYSEAQFEYAMTLLRGGGINADVPNALGYLMQAAEKGIAAAQNRLAHMLASGSLVKKDLKAAAKWRILAKHAGIKDDGLDKVVAGLSKADRAKAEAAAERWRQAGNAAYFN